MSSVRRTASAATICTGLAVGALVSGVAAARPPAPECQVIGVWELVGVRNNGSPVSMSGWAQRKVVTRGQFMWLGQAARRDTLPLRTAVDTLRAFSMSGGAGTWSLNGRTYTERLEYFVDPRMIGTDFPATCRTEGDRWIHTWVNSADRATVDEEWRRIE